MEKKFALTRQVKALPGEYVKRIEDFFSGDRTGNAAGSIFFDIETTGLSARGSCIIIIGFIYYDSNDRIWRTVDLFSDLPDAEEELIKEFFSYIHDDTALVSFNGLQFDIPFILQRCRLKKVAVPDHVKKAFEKSIDLFALIRKYKKAFGLDRVNQSYLERMTAPDLADRSEDLHGEEIINGYRTYIMKKKAAIMQREEPAECKELKERLILHNYRDILGMCLILPLAQICLYINDLKDLSGSRDLKKYCREIIINIGPASDEIDSAPDEIGPASDETISDKAGDPCISDNAVNTDAAFITVIPAIDHHFADLSAHSSSGCIHFSADRIHIKVDITHEKLRYFIPDYKDYYIDTGTGEPVHKSIAAFMDKGNRRRASRQDCFMAKEAYFVKVPEKTFLEISSALSSADTDVRRGIKHKAHIWKREYTEKESFLELEDLKDWSILGCYVISLLVML
jgi:uncharacterized protein YprB with RNaseH-like and TPR domain